MNKIAILTPSRERPDKLYRYFKSVAKNISNDSQLDFIVGIDKDDPEKKEYYRICMMMQEDTLLKNNITVLLYEDQLATIGKIWNALVRLRPFESASDLFIMGNDDIAYKTKDWDKILIGKRSSLDHPFYVSWFDDEINGDSHCAFPIVSKEWVGSLGYFMPELFRFFYHDTWVYEIAKRAGFTQYIPEVVAAHLHFSKHPGEYDKTSEDKRKDNIHQDDTKRFLDSANKRQDAANYIKGRALDYLRMKEAGKINRVSNENDREV